jgi:large subunit ribosomal protein L34e
MPRPSERTKTKKRIHVSVPGGHSSIHFRKEKVSPARCRRCGRVLSGFSRSTPSKISKLSSTEKRVERIYGGQLCPDCLRYLLKREVRNL